MNGGYLEFSGLPGSYLESDQGEVGGARIVKKLI